MGSSEIYLDIETERWSGEVEGGWSNIPGFGMALAMTWEPGNGGRGRGGAFRCWRGPENAAALIEYLGRLDRIITFNGERFDFKVLSAYGNVSILYERSFDLLRTIEKELGHRVALEALSRATLGRGKFGDGLQAVKWWRSKEVDLRARVEQYCRNDVDLLRSLVAYGRATGSLKFKDRSGELRMVRYHEPGERQEGDNRAIHPLILTVGLPRSGKTTWALTQGSPVVNRDAIRLALHGQAYVQDREEEVSRIEDLMVKSLFLAGHDMVIVDACHITQKRQDRWTGREEWIVFIKMFPVGKEECSRRAIESGREDLISVIERMAAETDIPELARNWSQLSE